jgi:uncharacterized protein
LRPVPRKTLEGAKVPISSRSNLRIEFSLGSRWSFARDDALPSTVLRLPAKVEKRRRYALGSTGPGKEEHMGRVVHFEISADDPDRAAQFYRKAFNWDVSDWGGPSKYLLVTTGAPDEAGINGAITERQEHMQAVINSIDVDSWERAAKSVIDAGGEVLTEKAAIPGIGYFAYCRDTERNVFGILESNPEAKAAQPPIAAGQITS